jgi:Xaa-Pro aminopeptidase
VSFHEEPRIVPGSSTVLQERMVIALEPAGFGSGIGCRTEHVMEVTPAGGRVLTDYEFGLER